jgi:hypothetical protein
MSAAIALDCSGCKSDQTMKPTKVTRFNTVLRLIGWIIVVPSILGVVFGFMTCFATTEAADATLTAAQSDAEAAGAAIGAGIAYGIAGFIAAGSLVGGVIGYLLLLKRKVFCCVRCGFILDRA